MWQWFKTYFIPHEENDHKPHMLRGQTVVFFVVMMLVFEVYFFAQIFLLIPSGGLFAAIFPSVLTDQTNTNRVALQEVLLRTNPFLIAAAQAKANDMAAKGYFAHTSPDGKSPWYWFGQAGYNFTYAGENLAVNFSDSGDVTTAWMNSPLHRENILNSNFTEIGIATAQGIYNGHEAIYVVQLFGRPAPTPSNLFPTATAATVPTPAPQPNVLASAQKTSPPPTVIKETSSSSAEGQNLFVAVRGAETSQENIAQETVGAASGSTKPELFIKQANIVQTLFASPRLTVNYVLGLIGILALFALALNVFIKVRIQHPRMIINGLFLLLLVSGVFVLNYYSSLSSLRIL